MEMCVYDPVLRETVIKHPPRLKALDVLEAKVSSIRLGEPREIVWPSASHPDTVEDSAPSNADAYMFLGDPRRRLGHQGREFVAIQYYKLKK